MNLIYKNQKIVIFGSKGMAGSAIQRSLYKNGYSEILGPTRKTLNLLESNDVKKWFSENKPEVVILAAAKVGGIHANSTYPANFILENLKIQTNVIETAWEYGVKKLLFSSTAAIYGEPEYYPIDENHPLKSLNPYGNTKLIIENILKDIFDMEKDWSILCLRYFNPVGSHPSYLIGDDPTIQKTTNLMPAIIKVVKGLEKFFEVFGLAWTCLDAFGPVRMHPDAFGCVWMRSDTFGKFQKFLLEKHVFHNALWGRGGNENNFSQCSGFYCCRARGPCKTDKPFRSFEAQHSVPIIVT